MIFYFSATGNSKHVGKRIGTATGEILLSVTDCLKNNEYCFEAKRDERIGFICPVYFWGIPKIMNDFIKRLKINTHGTHYIYSVVTYGTSTGQAGYLIDKALKDIKMNRNGHYAVRMVDTYTPLFNVNDKEKCKRRIYCAEHVIDIIIKRIIERECGNFDRLRLYHRLAAPYTYFNRNPQTKHFRINDKCIGCGLCAENCPIGAIRMKDRKPIWVKEHCMTCLKCLHHCPEFAIQYGKQTEKHGQFVYPESLL